MEYTAIIYTRSGYASEIVPINLLLSYVKSYPGGANDAARSVARREAANRGGIVKRLFNPEGRAVVVDA